MPTLCCSTWVITSPGRIPARSSAGISTFVAPLAEKPGWFGRVWERITEEVAAGRQAFVVCAAIDATIGAIMSAHPDSGEALASALRGTWILIHPGEAFEVDGAVLQTRMERLRGGWLMRNAVLIRIAAQPHLTIASRVAAQLARAWALALKLPEVRK